MREIKFRAFDTISGKIIEWDELTNYKNNIKLVNLKRNDTNLKWMQYTGLKDKNGKEIYEGDVLKSPYPNCKNIEIKWMTGGCCNFVATGWDWDQECIKNFEVIGNIYENPELI